MNPARKVNMHRAQHSDALEGMEAQRHVGFVGAHGKTGNGEMRRLASLAWLLVFACQVGNCAYSTTLGCATEKLEKI